MLVSMFARAIRESRHYPAVLAARYRIEYWRRGSNFATTPHRLKELTVIEYGRRFGIRHLIETGTYLGVMVQVAKRHYEQIDSIELEPTLAAKARWRFRKVPKVRIHEADSAKVLPRIMATVNHPCL